MKNNRIYNVRICDSRENTVLEKRVSAGSPFLAAGVLVPMIYTDFVYAASSSKVKLRDGEYRADVRLLDTGSNRVNVYLIRNREL